MIHQYAELIDQTFDFPQTNFEVQDDYLQFHQTSLKTLIDTYGTPLKISYLPNIAIQIEQARHLFKQAMDKANYQGKYHYCYCTKSSHFKFVLDRVLASSVQLETSSTFDINLVRSLHQSGQLTKSKIIIANGYKTEEYAYKISELINEGFYNLIPVCDTKKEVDYYAQNVKKEVCKLGLRIATEEEPQLDFYTSRLGIRHSEIVPFYREKIANNPRFQLKMLHFFMNTGIKDTVHYWNELRKSITIYCEMKKICPDLRALNIGGGLPIQNSLGFEYDYAYMIEEIVRQIKQACDDYQIPEPDLFTEFGKYTVGESGAVIFSVLGQKQQNDSELWYMIDNSLITTLPDSWGMTERFVLLPINKWQSEYQRVNIGGLSCDNSDYYNSEVHVNQVYLPKLDKSGEPLYVGFFHTGAYQDALSGYGGIKHCLIPSPKHVLIDRNEKGEIHHWLQFEEQKAEDMLRVLGY